MPARILRAVSATALAAAAMSVVVGGQAASASGTFTPGALTVYGPGTVPTFGTITHGLTQVAAANTTVTFHVNVANPDSTTHQYQVHVTTLDGLTPAVSPVLRAGGTDVTNLAMEATGFVTAGIAPGGTMAFTYTEKVVAGQITGDAVSLSDFQNNVLDTEILEAVPQAPASAGTGADLFIKSTVGGTAGSPVDSSAVTAPTAAAGGKATFTITLKNDGTTAHGIDLTVADVRDHACGAYWVIHATTPAPGGGAPLDISTDFDNGDYVSPSLAPGKSQVITFSLTRPVGTLPSQECRGVQYGLYASPTSGGNVSFAQVLANATVPTPIPIEDPYSTDYSYGEPPIRDAQFGIYGPGSAYSVSNSAAVQVVAPTKTGTYHLKVTNKSGAIAQFFLQIPFDIPGMKLTSGNTNITPLAETPQGYATGPLAATGSVTFTLTIPAQPDDHVISIYLHDGSGFTTAYELAGIAPQAGGTSSTPTGSDFFAKAASAYVAGGPSVPFVGAAAIKGTQKATYTLLVKNTTNSPKSYLINGSFGSNPPECVHAFPIAVSTKGTSGLAKSFDVTSEVLGAGYQTDILAPGKTQIITATVSYSAVGNPGNVCGFSGYIFSADGHSQLGLITSLAA